MIIIIIVVSIINNYLGSYRDMRWDPTKLGRKSPLLENSSKHVVI